MILVVPPVRNVPIARTGGVAIDSRARGNVLQIIGFEIG